MKSIIKKVKGFSSAYPNICNLKLLPNIDGTWITIRDDVGTSMTIKLSDLSAFMLEAKQQDGGIKQTPIIIEADKED